uniref:Uncharacterized protein n=1 Tax=Arundo donax TaxID=35708 RepID=A0A0A8ZJM2_ARUDO
MCIVRQKKNSRHCCLVASLHCVVDAPLSRFSHSAGVLGFEAPGVGLLCNPDG